MSNKHAPEPWAVAGGLAEENVRMRLLAAEKQRDELISAIETTLDENGHLADGDDCTLIALKRAIASVRGAA